MVSPLDGAIFEPGERVTLRVAAVSNSNVIRIEVHSGGVLVATQDNATPSPTFTTPLIFVINQTGQIKLTVTAIDSNGKTSDPQDLTIVVGGGTMLGGTFTATPPPGSSTATQTDNGCKLAATFVTDVTIPDNTIVNPGAGFVKTWRLRNTSACAWDSGYSLAYSEGEKMGAPDSVAVASTAPNASVDVSVPFTASISSGTYTSTWRLRAPDGTSFGNRVYVVIRVP
ncbi:MAG TPA: NBR1-Ig-like domain-containing protein [Anaerolineae bacterium]